MTCSAVDDESNKIRISFDYSEKKGPYMGMKYGMSRVRIFDDGKEKDPVLVTTAIFDPYGNR